MAQLKAKLWVGIGAFALAGVQIDVLKTDLRASDLKFRGALAASPGGEGGEGGEGGARARASKNSADEAKFLQLLALVEGHLLVGTELYRQGAIEAAKTHMKHPGDELYASLTPYLKKLRSPGFGNSLQRLATAVEAGAPRARVDDAFKKVRVEIDAARRAGRASVRLQLDTVGQLVRIAGDEYKEGVQAGKVVMPHEYQDAYGFVTVARELLERIKPTSKSQLEAIAAARQSLGELEPAWPSLTATGEIRADSSLLYAAASRIELAASSVR